MEKSIQIASIWTFGCGENGPERAAETEPENRRCVRLPVPLHCDVATERNNSAGNRHYRDFITANVIMITL